jgi:uncharacterized protein
MRNLFAALCGAIFGLGLYVSGMTDTDKVKAWLDLLGNWDPTLAFVLGGAVLPMIVVWRIAYRNKVAYLGNPIPPLPEQIIDARLILGAAIFGTGWAISGFCPGPAVASLGYGGFEGVVFFVMMIAGMILQSYVPKSFGLRAVAV